MADKLRVLIVDDNPGIGRSTALVLNHKGYSVDTAQDGQAAIAKFGERPFDVVLMDLKMPEMNGVDVFKRLKEMQPGIPVIIVTAYATEDLVEEALREGARDVVHKPLDFEALLTTIAEVTRQNSDQ